MAYGSRVRRHGKSRRDVRYQPMSFVRISSLIVVQHQRRCTAPVVATQPTPATRHSPKWRTDPASASTASPAARAYQLRSFDRTSAIIVSEAQGGAAPRRYERHETTAQNLLFYQWFS